ncbi:hypothetical protein Tco_1336009, partial [Tanacetum coccineum]
YCFKAIIDDGTATATLICFSPEAHTFVPDCNTVLTSTEDKDTYQPSYLSPRTHSVIEKSTPDTKEPSPSTKDNVEEKTDNPGGKKKPVKRTLFQEADT